MRADDEELEVSVALHHLAGKRKREEDAANTDSEASPPCKILRSSRESTPLECPGAPRMESRELGTEPASGPRHRLTKESLQGVKDRLASLTLRNKEIKEAIQSLRKTVIENLFTHMKVRQLAIGQLGRIDLGEDMIQLCTKALDIRKTEIYTKTNELTTLEELLCGHKAVLDFADSAYMELEHNIASLEMALRLEQSTVLSSCDFPHMSALARLTGGGAKPISSPTPELPELPRSRRRLNVFPQFAKLPPELRIQIWQEALPNPRIITHNSRHNRNFSILAVNKESRAAVLTRLTRLLSPTFETNKTDTQVIYVDLKTDTIIRDLANPEGADPFDLQPTAFNSACYRLFIGLAKVKHLAVAFDVLHNNGGKLFGPIQACCPELESLILFPSSMVPGGPLARPKKPTCHKSKFVDLDSNLIDYVYQRWQQLPSRTLKRKAFRGVAILVNLHDHVQQYYSVFPRYAQQYGRGWTPSIRICLMVRWNERCKAWQTRYLKGDRYSKGFIGNDGRLYKGFVESGMLCEEDGEILSRYDGIERMFEQLSIQS